ncbi:MAG: TrpR-related protein YerC/YecD [Clostridiales bacterium]|nr:TrpR-related protein YerC/YecD [Clostridiales bacterium]
MVKEAKVSEEMKKLLYTTILNCKTVEDLEDLFDDLCTFKEVEQMAQRIESARMLADGKTYAEIIEKTEISSATLSRVSRCVQRGSGGYLKFLPKN